MKIREIEVARFDDLFPRQACVYDTAEFCLLNGSKAEALKAFALLTMPAMPWWARYSD